MAFIYRATNKENGKFYIGRTAYDKLSKRINTHWHYAKTSNSNLPFPNALRKYGRDGFEWDVLEECAREEAGTREMIWIEELKPQYNATRGGDGGRYGIPCPAHVAEAARQANRKGVKCVETRQVFDTDKEAAAWAGVSRRAINNCVRGKAFTSGGYHWKRC